MIWVRSGIIAVLFLSWLQGPVMAQSVWLEDPFSELVQSIAPRAPMRPDVPQFREQRRTVDIVRHKQIAIPRRAKSVEQARVIRAKAEVTIIDRDHVVVTLTRHGIGDVNATSALRLRR